MTLITSAMELLLVLKEKMFSNAKLFVMEVKPGKSLTRIFQWKNPASLRLRTAKGLLNLSRKENVSQTLSSSTSGLNPLPF